MIDIKDLIAQNRNGTAIGLPCFCTANEHVLKAVLSYASKTGFPTVIEATCNQVNQEGGYTGMTPADFMGWLKGMAKDAGVPMDQLILGGDHLGPNPWRSESIEVAMEKARDLVRLYVEAGFQKIHLDASMACGGEPNPTFAQIAERAAELCEVAEKYAPDPEKLIYVIGTEVPIPGGETEEPDVLDVTSVDRLHDTIETHRAAFKARGLDRVWPRIVSVVTQPGVDFGHTSIYPFEPAKAKPLSKVILQENGLTYEAHSTDYQSTEALSELVAHHFFFLKVGPELTFRFREAIWALARIEDVLRLKNPSGVCELIAEVMTNKPANWQDYYNGPDQEVEQLKIYSYSDRIRYYWADPQVATAVNKLTENLDETDIPETVISQAFMGLDFGEIPTDTSALLGAQIERCVARYFQASGFVESKT